MLTPRDYALLAQESYKATPDIGKADSASRAILRETDSGLCVVFRGSDDAAAWVQDLKAIAVTTPTLGRVHLGFWQAWSAIADQVIAAVGDRPVTFVGHSLGAALAVIAAASFTVASKPPIAVYGFEPPRVSPDINITGILINVPVYLYKNGNDIVPDVPWFWNQAAPLELIGKASSPIPNVEDHKMANVIQAFPSAAITST